MSVPEEESLLVVLVHSFLVDPVLTAAVDMAPVDPHSPTAGPNRYTLNVPSETTRLSLGEKSANWNTDAGITGYTNNHIHFEAKGDAATIISLGGPATVSGIHDGPVPSASNGYSMVTSQNAWQDAAGQHYLISQQADISLSTRAAGKRAVVQSDHGIVDMTGGQQVSVSGGGISIGAGELELEDVGYEESWKGDRPHSTAAAAGKIAMSIAGVCSALQDLVVNKAREKFDPGTYSVTEKKWYDVPKRAVNGAMLAAALGGLVYGMVAKNAPAKGVKIDAEKTIGIVAGGVLGFFARAMVSMGSAAYATISGGVSAVISGVAFAGVGGTLVGIKGFRKTEIGSDWGEVFVGAETEIKLKGEQKFTASAGKIAHLTSLEANAMTILSGEKVWMGVNGWGMSLTEEELAIGKTAESEEIASRTVKPFPAIRLDKKRIELKGDTKTTLTLNKGNCTITVPMISFEATSGDVTVNGASILMN